MVTEKWAMAFVFTNLVSLMLIGCGAHSSSDSTTVKPTLYLKLDTSKLQSCTLDVPCASGESCNSYSGGRPVCYPSGRESELAGCTEGELFFFLSYPGVAGCT